MCTTLSITTIIRKRRQRKQDKERSAANSEQGPERLQDPAPQGNTEGENNIGELDTVHSIGEQEQSRRQEFLDVQGGEGSGTEHPGQDPPVLLETGSATSPLQELRNLSRRRRLGEHRNYQQIQRKASQEPGESHSY
jgi:hypothetical protein